MKRYLYITLAIALLSIAANIYFLTCWYTLDGAAEKILRMLTGPEAQKEFLKGFLGH